MSGPAPRRLDESEGGTLANSLTQNFIDCFEVPLSQIRLTAFTRPINDRGLDVMREGLPNRGFTEDCTLSIVHIVLDGNHRLAAAKKIMSRDTRLRCRVHYAFDAAAMRVLGDSLNDATETITARTTYDTLYLHAENMKGIKKRNKKTNVTAQEMAKAYRTAGINPPSVQTLRIWKKVVCGLSQEAFEAVRDVFQSAE